MATRLRVRCFPYFAIREKHFAARAKGMIACPSGFGTMDERFEILTLVQTGKMARIPIVLVGTGFWQRAINFGFRVQEGTVAREDLDFFYDGRDGRRSRERT